MAANKDKIPERSTHLSLGKHEVRMSQPLQNLLKVHMAWTEWAGRHKVIKSSRHIYQPIHPTLQTNDKIAFKISKGYNGCYDVPFQPKLEYREPKHTNSLLDLWKRVSSNGYLITFRTL